MRVLSGELAEIDVVLDDERYFEALVSVTAVTTVLSSATGSGTPSVYVPIRTT